MVCGLTVSSDGKLLASTGADAVTRLWDFATGRLVRELPGGQLTLSFSSNGKYLASRGKSEGPITWWEVATGKQLGKLTGNYLCHAFTPDGKLLATGVRDGPVRFWDAATAKEVDAPEEYPSGTRALVFTPDGKRGAAVDQNGLHLIDAATGEEIWHVKEIFDTLAFSADGKVLAGGTYIRESPDDSISLFDSASGKELRQMQGPKNGVHYLDFSADGSILASGSHDGIARIWETSTGKELCRIDGDDPREHPLFALMPDGKTLLSAGRSSTIRLWDTATGKELSRPWGHANMVTTLEFAPNGKVLLTASRDKSIRLWDPTTGKELRRFETSKDSLDRVVFSPAGGIFAWHAPNNSMRLTDVDTGKVVREFARDRAGGRFAFAPDGNTLAVASGDHKIRLWQLPRGKELRELPGPEKGLRFRNWECLAFSPDGKRLAAALGRGLRGRDVHDDADDKAEVIWLWEAATGKVLLRFSPPEQKGEDGIWNLLFSPDGKALLTTGEDQVIREWDVETGTETRQLKVPGLGLDPLRMSSDGRLLAFIYWDNSIRIWELATGREVRTLKGHSSFVTSLAFSPDGRTLASASLDTTALVWNVLELSERQGAQLSPEELKAVWEDLTGADAAKAYRGVAALASSPGQAAPFLRERLRPVILPEDKQLARLLADLDSDDFSTREKATRELEALGETAAPALRKVLEGKPSVETRRRVSRLLEQAAGKELAPEQLRVQRALAALEYAAAPEARRLLEELGQGAPEARLTRDAKAALKRLDKRTATKPDEK
jgi:WD40 repeat protein